VASAAFSHENILLIKKASKAIKELNAVRNKTQRGQKMKK
jgi:hypothetical protein